MQAQKLGVLSAIAASLCCVGPLLLAVLGLGGLGVGAFIGAYHWYFIAGATALLGVAWWNYWRERQRCATERCEMVGGRLARITLPLTTLAVAIFFGPNLYTYAGDGGSIPSLVADGYAQTTIPVDGMTCFSCTVHVEGSLQDLDGVRNVKASVSDKSVAISYDPAKIDVVQLVAAINETGYRAREPVVQ